jgi:ubiquinone/menaquinone biosynthesis C-methylase UbiE
VLLKHALYSELAGYYDVIYSRKDYKGETVRLRELIQENLQSPGKNLLEVACGTGRYLEHIEKHFSCSGIDLNPEMLRVARRRLKKTTVEQGDMRAFNLGLQFDVVLCLFSSIANLKNYRELRQTMKNISNHLLPGGVFILGPFLHPGEFLPKGSRLFTYESPDLKVARIDTPKLRGNKVMLDFHWLIAEKGKPIKYIPNDQHELIMFTQQQYLESMRLAGLTPRFLKGEKSAGNPLYLATKPRA